MVLYALLMTGATQSVSPASKVIVALAGTAMLGIAAPLLLLTDAVAVAAVSMTVVFII
jgi:hypothetical protein